MQKFMAILILILLNVSAPAWGERITVRRIKESPREAILVGTETGAEKHVREGDRVNGSIVHEIRCSHVTFVTPLSARQAMSVKFPVMDENFFALTPQF